MRIELDKIGDLRKYIRNDKECFFDPTKKILRIATPEENVRQSVLVFLHEKMNIPYTAMETEIPLSYFVENARGRMDIVIYGLKDDLKYPIMVVECKAKDVLLTDDVYDQVKRYAEIVDIPIFMVTNGINADIVIWNYEKNQYEQIKDYPTYKELCAPNNLERVTVDNYVYKRYEYQQLYESGIIEKEYELGDFIGADCTKDMASYIINLAECLLDTSHRIEKLSIGKYNFIEDGGVRFTSFGNASGGVYPGLYRFVVVKDRKENVQVVSFAVLGCLNGRSLLIVAIDDFDKHHNSLQLSLEHFTECNEKKIKIFHDGTLTVGKRGKAKKQEVIEFVNKHSSLVVNKNRIELGELDVSKLLYTDSKDVTNFLGNIIEYALVRDEFRCSY